MTKIEGKKKNTDKASSLANSGYFLLNFSSIEKIVTQKNSYENLVVYTILSYGVDNKLAPIDAMVRLSTHGEKSISTRSNLTRKKIKNSLLDLEGMGLIRNIRGESSTKDDYSPTFEILRCEDDEYIEVDSTFVNTSVNSKGPSNLFKILESSPNCPISSNGGNAFKQARVEILFIFYKLLKEQNFEDFSGVNPELFGINLCNIDDNSEVNWFNDDLCHDGKLFLVKEATVDKKFDYQWVEDSLKNVLNECDACMNDRAVSVINNLFNQKMVKSIITLWCDDVLGAVLNNPMESKRSNIRKKDPSELSIHVRSAAIEKLISEGYEKSGFFNRIGDFKLDDHDNDGFFGEKYSFLFLVGKKISEKIQAKQHLRVAYWAKNEDKFRELKSEDLRNKDYLQKLNSMKIFSLL